MSHDEIRDLIHAYVDGELDIPAAREVEKHLRDCAECRALEKQTRELREALRRGAAAYRAPASLRRNVKAALRREAAPEAPNAWKFLALAGAACAALLLAAFIFQAIGRSRTNIADEVVANHVRSLLATHLVDVPSSNRHTVKPWFDGKIDFAPDVPDLSADGFPLVGGRLDYLNGRPVVALVYERNKHPINLFVAPAASRSTQGKSVFHRRGYNIVHWSSGEMELWAVSDLNAQELQQFASDFSR